MGLNDHGLVACLLNGYVTEDLELMGRPGVPSRGEIIPSLLAQPPSEVWGWIDDGLDPTPYPSFTLLVMDLERGVELRWRRCEELVRQPMAAGWTMASSSFLRPDEILPWRRDRFTDWVAVGAPTTAGIPDFNLLEEPGCRDRSPFMTRPYSATRSVTQAVVDGARSEVALRWWPRSGDGPVRADHPETTMSLGLVATGLGIAT
jgi:hypothetical protein